MIKQRGNCHFWVDPFFCISFFFFILLEWICNVILSAVQHSDSIIHIHASTLFQTLFPYRSSQNVGQSFLCYKQQVPVGQSFRISLCAMPAPNTSSFSALLPPTQVQGFYKIPTLCTRGQRNDRFPPAPCKRFALFYYNPLGALLYWIAGRNTD